MLFRYCSPRMVLIATWFELAFVKLVKFIRCTKWNRRTIKNKPYRYAFTCDRWFKAFRVFIIKSAITVVNNVKHTGGIAPPASRRSVESNHFRFGCEGANLFITSHLSPRAVRNSFSHVWENCRGEILSRRVLRRARAVRILCTLPKPINQTIA